MTEVVLKAKRRVNLGKQPSGRLLFWTENDVKEGVVKTAEITPLIERYVNDGLLVIVKKEIKKEPVEPIEEIKKVVKRIRKHKRK